MSQTMSQPGMGKSSAQPGVSGESRNTPWGPQAVMEQGIDNLKDDVQSYRAENNEIYRESSADDDCFDTFIDTSLTQSGMGESSLKP